MVVDFVWLKHEETGNSAQFSDEAAPIWRKRGWVDCDPPVTADPTTAHLAEVAAPPAVDDPAAAAEPVPPAQDAPKNTRRNAGADHKEAAE